MDGSQGGIPRDQAFAAGRGPDAGAIIESGSIRCDYQPIVSVKGNRVIGFEALARASDPRSGAPIGPDALFSAAAREGLTLELDRLCRKRAVEGFVASGAGESELALFMNIDTSVIGPSTIGSNRIRDLAEEHGLEPGRVVIELLESEIRDEPSLREFVERYHRLGFIIALDDVGSGHSNLERIVSLKPDVIKLDRSLISGIEREFHKQELLGCLIKLTAKLGILAIAEGVETEAEAQACLSKGADIMQGFLLGRPGSLGPEPREACLDSCLDGCLERAREATETHKALEERRIPERRLLYRSYDALTSRICEGLARCSRESYDEALAEALAWFIEVECAYILDRRGVQVSSTVFNPARPRRKASALYAPSVEGDDQSAKDYFLFLDGTSRRYITEPYLSRASGAVCVTISTTTEDSSAERIILCLDIDLEDAP